MFDVLASEGLGERIDITTVPSARTVQVPGFVKRLTGRKLVVVRFASPRVREATESAGSTCGQSRSNGYPSAIQSGARLGGAVLLPSPHCPRHSLASHHRSANRACPPAVGGVIPLFHGEGAICRPLSIFVSVSLTMLRGRCDQCRCR